jgi:CHAT domain-containing protein
MVAAAALRARPPSDPAETIAALRGARALDRFLRRRRDLHDVQTVESLTDKVARTVHVDLDQAEQLARAAGWIARRLRDEYCRARALRAEGNVLFSRGKLARALERFQKAIALFARLGQASEVGRTQISSLQTLIYLGRYPEAMASAEAARRIFEQAGDRLRLARLDTNVANLLYRQDRFPEALALYQRACGALREEGDARDVAVALRNIAVCHISLNQFQEALSVYAEARSFSERHGMPLLVVENDYNIAYLYYLRGEYTRAIELYQAARARAQALGDTYHAALCDLDQSELFLELNLIAEGAELAQRAYAGFERLGMRYEAAKGLTNLAIGAGRGGEAFRALDLFEKAREMFHREDNAVWRALIDAFRSVVLYEEGRAYEARRLAQSALRFFDGARLGSKAALCELVLARVHLWLGELVSARARCSAALTRLERADEPALSYRAYLLLGQVHEALGDREAALVAYRAAHERLENLRSHLEQDELKIGFLKDKLAVYESLVWMTLAGPTGPAELETALQYVEQAKSRSLADLMAFRAHALPARATAQSDLVERVRGLRQELNWYYRKIDLAELHQRRSVEQIEALRRSSREREVELLRTLRDLHTSDEELASMQVAGTAGLEAIRSTLPADGMLLEYYEARGTIMAVVVGRERLAVLPLTPASRARHLLRLLQFQLSKFRLGPEYTTTFAQTLHEATLAHLTDLYAELVAPVRDLLDARRLVVVPHDFLHYVPFHALYDGRRYLADEFAVSYAPSASVHYLCCRKEPRGQGSLVLGVPDPATPFIESEARRVAEALPSARLFLGEEADEGALRRHGAESRFVHIATHGMFRYDNPMFSSLQLGGSRLSLFDLYQLKLSAELVTLSGCGTGLNVVEGADELMGLVRGLLYAGAQAALVTLWDVNDQTTEEFMTAFYRRLPEAAGKAQALREAMWQIREKYPHPFYWAPFVLVGKGH